MKNIVVRSALAYVERVAHSCAIFTASGEQDARTPVPHQARKLLDQPKKTIINRLQIYQKIASFG